MAPLVFADGDVTEIDIVLIEYLDCRRGELRFAGKGNLNLRKSGIVEVEDDLAAGGSFVAKTV